MPQLDSHQQRQFALEVVKRLRAAGFEALWAGGCVRDQLLGSPPKDYDVATSATPDEVRDLFGRRRTIAVGASFGVITVVGPKLAGAIEVATFRTDGGYSDGRHPDQVQYSTPEHDAQRRDFTINGLFFDPVVEQVHDYVGGQKDLTAKVVRAIGDPEARIAEDKLRMLRAVRFAARFEFTLEPKTLAAIRHHAGEIVAVSGERIGAEMRTMLTHPHRVAALTLLNVSGLESFVLPEMAQLTDNGRQHALAIAARLAAPELGVVLAGLLRDLPDVRVAGAIASRWKLSNRDVDLADWLLDHLPLALAADQAPWPCLQRVLVHPDGPQLVELAAAIVGEQAAAVQRCRAKLALPVEQLDPPLLLTGADLIAAGLQPGPQFRMILETVRDAQLEGDIKTKESALLLARELHDQSP